MSEPKVILITGASSGNGQATAQLLAQQGYKVFGTSRNPAGSDNVLNYKMLALDVCSDESVRACVNSVLEQVGQIDVLVNNAGYEQGGALEEISDVYTICRTRPAFRRSSNQVNFVELRTARKVYCRKLICPSVVNCQHDYI